MEEEKNVSMKMQSFFFDRKFVIGKIFIFLDGRRNKHEQRKEREICYK